ncbi:MAG: hypothetical protein AB7E51_05325 [Pseudodesulfovibrio sp.]|uniref:hypothetical protein n=1 Tax=Pseudodesulfovibrio sp. TaxID=2035812 RepID=UPI003D0BEF1C
MLISTPEELIDAAFGIIDEKIDAKSIEISDDFVIKIKIRDDEWNDPLNLDYRIANIIIKLQSDILGFYNSTSGSSVTLKNIDKNSDLIVKVVVNEGCTELLASIKKIIDRVFIDMNPKEKLVALGIILAIVASGGVAWVGVDYVNYLKTTKVAELESKNQLRAIEALEATQLALINNRRTPEYIASNVKTGTLQIGSEKPITGKALKSIKKVEIQPREVSCNIDEVYSVTKYDFKELLVNLEGGAVPFSASVEFLDDASRRKLRKIAGLAIDTKTVQSASLQITATIQDGAVKHAAIVGIGDKRPNSKKLTEILQSSKTTDDTPQAVQGRLLP